MAGSDRSTPPPGMDGEDLHDLARDWITLWQSELAALAADREAQETWRVLLSMWAGAAGALLRAMPRGGANEPAGRSAGPTRLSQHCRGRSGKKRRRSSNPARSN